MSKLSGVDIDYIVEARERGVSCGVLARKYGVAVGTIGYHCDRLGVIPPGGFRTGTGRVSRGVAMSEDELRVMESLASTGVTVAEIGRRLKRPRNTINYRLKRLALVAESKLEERIA